MGSNRPSESKWDKTIDTKELGIDKMKKLIGENFHGKQIAILGLAFKPNTDDIRDSASIIIIDSIMGRGTFIPLRGLRKLS